MLKSLLIHEKSRVTRAIYDLKRSITALEEIKPRTPKIEAALNESKQLEQQLCEASENPKFIKNLIENSLREMKAKADILSKTQSKRSSKPRKTGGITPQERDERNQKIREHFKKASKNGHISLHGFAEKHADKYCLKPTRLKQIIKSSLDT